MKKVEKIIDVFANALNVICIAAIAVTMIMVTVDVFMRFVFSKPISGVTELVQCCWILMTTSFGVLILTNGNTMVDVFTEKMHPQVKRIVILIMDLAAIVFCFIVGWRTILKALSSADSNIMYVMLGIKEWPIMMAFAIAFLIAGLATIAFTIREWRENTADCRAYKLNGGKKKEQTESGEV